MEKEKLNVLKQQWQSLSQQIQQFQSQCKELSEEELKEVTGGAGYMFSGCDTLTTRILKFDNNESESNGGTINVYI